MSSETTIWEVERNRLLIYSDLLATKIGNAELCATTKHVVYDNLTNIDKIDMLQKILSRPKT